MSSAGQVIGGVVGGVIGFFAGGNVVYGAQIGMMIGGLLDPPKTKGPRLEDLTAQTSTYGAFIPRLYGMVAVFGNVFWIQGDRLVEREAEADGKGGPSVTNFEYYATFAVGLCEGPIDGVRRIWVGGQLWYDVGSEDIATIIASNQNSDKFTLYLGTDTQTADPTIQADRGAANVPAYRGLAYIVFNELPLKDHGNTLAAAQVKVEICKSSTVLPPRLLSYTDVAGYPLTYYPHPSYSARDGVLWFYSYNPFSGYSVVDGEYVANDEAVVGIASNGEYIGVKSVPGDVIRAQISSSSLDTIRIGKFGGFDVWWPEYSSLYAIQNGAREVMPWGFVGDRNTASVSGSLGDIADALSGEVGRYIIGVSISGDGEKIMITTGATTRFAFDSADRYFVMDTGLNIVSSGAISDTAIGIWNIGNAITSEKNQSGTVLEDSGECGWTSSSNSGVSVDVRYYYIDSGGTMQVSAVIASTLVGIDYLATAYSDGLFYVLARTSTKARLYTYTAHPTMAGTPALLGDIVQSECLKSDLLTAGDLDVTELTDSVRGYRVSALAPLRGGIDPLRKAWPFDAIQRGYKIKFKKRGGASVATITEGELDARAAGDEPGVRISNSREMDLVLPDQLTVQYLDAAREYDVNVAEESR